jgi:hypothetical protein
LGSADLAAGFLISFLSGGAVQKLPCWASAKAHISSIAKTRENHHFADWGHHLFSSKYIRLTAASYNEIITPEWVNCNHQLATGVTSALWSVTRPRAIRSAAPNI